MIGRYEAAHGVFRRVSRAPHTPVGLSLPARAVVLHDQVVHQLFRFMVKNITSLNGPSIAGGALGVSREREAICQPIQASKFSS